MPLSAPGRARVLCVARCLALVFVLSSCGAIAYDRAWARFDDVEEGDGLVGRWRGEWRSDWNGHAGGLRCMMTHSDEYAYLARFYSTYGWFFFFRHETVFHVTGRDDAILRFEGAEDLGKMFGGLYRYQGSVAGDRFEARYEAENGDHGVFLMQRVE